jgi:hypothetical protein
MIVAKTECPCCGCKINVRKTTLGTLFLEESKK